MWNPFRKWRQHRLPLVVALLICILAPPIVWRVLTSTPTATPPAPGVDSDLPTSSAFRLFVSSPERFYGVVFYSVNHSSVPSEALAAPFGPAPAGIALVDDSRDGALDLLRLAAVRTGKVSFQFVYDPRRQKVYYYAVGTSTVRLHLRTLEIATFR